MPLMILCLLAIVQGLTEFIPVSSSAHLLLVHYWSGTEGDSLALDVAVHIGSVIAVLIYLRKEVLQVLRGLVQLLTGNRATTEAQLAQNIVLVTIPTLLAGAVLSISGLIDHLRNPTVIGVTMITFGLWLWWADQKSPSERDMKDFNIRDVLRLGLWQAVALIPGTSRSGVTMTMARQLKFRRTEAARLSMLMSIPVTLASGGYLGIKIAKDGMPAGMWGDIFLAAALSFAAAYVALILMMRFLRTTTFTPYVIYRLVLGMVLLAITLT